MLRTHNASCTDGKDPEGCYADAVNLRCDLNYLLDDKNQHKGTSKLRGTLLVSQLYGRARDFT